MPSLGRKVVISDTIGFIANLPPDLVEAFTSTLMESVHADVVFHVIDASDPDIMEKVHVVNAILDELHIPQEKVVLVFTKTDLISAATKVKIIENARDIPYVFVSAKTQEGIEELVASILPRFIPPVVR
jgi:GTP-binding protein HflX